MSRRPPAGPDRTEQNRATLKQLVKLEANKSCADCKRNKHPRWASWNLGIFVCIRCSGIHRGLGTHISRVKSVDLDSWTDEQTQSMIRWGNARANRYWESKLAEGHVPNEAKIENFIRTKYDSRRWVMDGPMPDPNTLGGEDESADDDVPLNVVREKALERSASLRNGAAAAGTTAGLSSPPRQRQPQVDLFGDTIQSEPVRSSSTQPALQRPGPPKAAPAPPKQTRPGESLLGLDFFGGSQSAPPQRPASTGLGNSGAASGRADLKSSILSLYASKPAAAPQPPPQQANADPFGGMASVGSQSQSATQSLGGLGDAFSSLSFSSQPAKAAPFSNLSSPTGHSRQISAAKPALSGGTFFDAKPPAPSKNPPPIVAPRKESFGNDFGDFSSGPSPGFSTGGGTGGSTSGTSDLFGLSNPVSAPAPVPPPVVAQQSFTGNSAFNLSQKPAPKPAPAATSSFPPLTNFSSVDAWGSNDAWASSEPAAAPAAPAAPAPAPAPAPSSASTFKPAPPISTQTAFDSGWGDPTPAPPPPKQTASSSFTVQQDEEFGGWSHASPVATTSGPKQGGLGGNQDDLFGNVWG